MATPRSSGPTKSPPFGKSKSNVSSGAQPPIKAKPAGTPSVGQGRPFSKPGSPKPSMRGMGGS